MNYELNYQAEKARLIATYDHLATLTNWFPLRNYETPQALLEKRDQLAEDRFVLCIAGQLKAGKSTLLNALLFQDEILPTWPTAMTAAISRIEHVSRSPEGRSGFQAFFYSRDEWRQLKDSYRAQEATSLWASFQEDVEKARLAGVIEAEYLDTPPVFHENFSRLVEYVGALDNGGRFTPFVKEAVLYYDYPVLEAMTIVDTPGTNDPNPVREAIAVEYYKKADAIWFATYAGRVLDAQDVQLLTQHLGHMDTRRLSFVITKLDVASSRDDLGRYLEKLKKHAILSPYLESGRVQQTCARATLLQQLECKGRLTDEQRLEMDRFKKLGFDAPDSAGVDRLRRYLEDEMSRRKEETVLASHRAEIASLVRMRLAELQADLADAERERVDMGKNQAELQAEIDATQITTSKYVGKAVELAGQISPRFISCLDKLHQRGKELSDSFPASLSRMLDYNSPKKLRDQLPTMFKKQLDDMLGELILEGQKQFSYEMENSLIIITKELSEIDSGEYRIPVERLKSIVLGFGTGIKLPDANKIAAGMWVIANNIYNEVYWFFNRWFDNGAFAAGHAKKEVESSVSMLLKVDDEVVYLSKRQEELTPIEFFLVQVNPFIEEIKKETRMFFDEQIRLYLDERKQKVTEMVNNFEGLTNRREAVEMTVTHLHEQISSLSGDAVLGPFISVEAQYA